MILKCIFGIMNSVSMLRLDVDALGRLLASSLSQVAVLAMRLLFSNHFYVCLSSSFYVCLCFMLVLQGEM